MAIFTPDGTGIGLLPIRDMFYFNPSKLFVQKKMLPNLTKQLATDFRFLCGAAGHQAFRRGDDTDAESADDGLDVHRADVTARPWARNALQPGDDTAAVRRVLQEHAEHLVRLVFVHILESGDVALFLQDTGN